MVEPIKPQPTPRRFYRTTMRRVEHHTVELTADTLRDLLRRSGITVPPTAAVFVHVPGGGDFSNEDLEITDDCPVMVIWTSTFETTG